MTELADMREEARYIQRILRNAEQLRKQIQKRAITKMARGEDVKEMMEVLQMTKDEEDDE